MTIFINKNAGNGSSKGKNSSAEKPERKDVHGMDIAEPGSFKERMYSPSAPWLAPGMRVKDFI